ncbi:hypothetical protein Snoj_03090 [Streptomyces nojiriensis]|uniref:Uncharacterized protein n=2 Tax=Streptomyces nojiriensis TaxID=66374 RepID=A0ABQ3SE42_9ACTN|nr:hypothetical protein GCM10010205_49510 [Streptomyces nojiriensis]GHI66391.1 hypothetical protein Snoj_03090 [Streptomyces nojiriensis]
MRPMCRYPLGRESWITPNEVPEQRDQGAEMFEYEIANAVRSADLIREAAEYRTARAAGRAHRASSPDQEHRRRVRTLRSRFTRSVRSAPRTA